MGLWLSSRLETANQCFQPKGTSILRFRPLTQRLKGERKTAAAVVVISSFFVNVKDNFNFALVEKPNYANIIIYRNNLIIFFFGLRFYIYTRRLWVPKSSISKKRA